MKIIPAVAMLALVCASGCSQTGESNSTNDTRVQVTTGSIDSHNSRNSLDWAGSYNAVFPCRDCDAVEITITLMRDGSFARTVHRRGEPTPPAIERGQFTWDQDGRTIALVMASGEIRSYQVGESKLFAIDREANRLSGDNAAHPHLDKLARD